MKMLRLGFGLFAGVVPAIATATSGQEAVDPATIDIRDAIECRLDAPAYNAFAMALNGEDKLAARRGWKPVTSANFLLAEYDLPAPIVVAGGYSTRRIAVTSSGVLAVLDQADPRAIARQTQVENALGAGALPDEKGKSRKFLGERVLRDVTDPVDGDQYRARRIVARSVSTVATHLGKTLYGCSYRIEMLDKDGNPL